MIRIRKEPLAVPNEVLLFRLSKKASSVNKVLLSGEGADELFLGYNRIFGWAANHTNFQIEEFAFHYGYERRNGDLELFQDAVSPYLHFGSTFKIVKAFFQISHLQGLLRRLDNSTMLAGVEGRAPFTDHHLVERMFSTLPESQFDGSNHKAQLRRIASRRLPKSIAYRSKVGFPVDFDKIIGQKIGVQKHSNSPLGYSNWFDFNLKTLGYQEESN
jgi:asparagine synthase (glutamine-hydrolysing)